MKYIITFSAILVPIFFSGCTHMLPCPQSEIVFNKEEMIFKTNDTNLYFSHIVINDFNPNQPQHQPTLYELVLKDESQKSNVCRLYTDTISYIVKGNILSLNSKKDLRFSVFCKKNNHTIGRKFTFCLHECYEKNTIIKSRCP